MFDGLFEEKNSNSRGEKISPLKQFQCNLIYGLGYKPSLYIRFSRTNAMFTVLSLPKFHLVYCMSKGG